MFFYNNNNNQALFTVFSLNNTLHDRILILTYWLYDVESTVYLFVKMCLTKRNGLPCEALSVAPKVSFGVTGKYIS